MPYACLLGCTWHKSLSIRDSPEILVIDLSKESKSSEFGNGIGNLNIEGCAFKVGIC